MRVIKEYLKLLRPHQWIKNLFVFSGIIFGNQWGNPEVLLKVLIAFISFCLISSAVYIYNDIIDIQYDKLHPIKKYRPIPSGEISIAMARYVGILLFLMALLLGCLISYKIIIILLSYSVLNILYSHYLKNIVIVDVFSISLGFILRILAGTLGVGILPSQWLLFCGFMITLFFGFSKRRAELDVTGQARAVLKNYSPLFLDKMIGITAGCSVVGYGLYSINSKTQGLIYTLPFVTYGIFRYLYLLHRPNIAGGEDAVKDIIHDKHLLITILLWVGIVIGLIAYK